LVGEGVKKRLPFNTHEELGENRGRTEAIMEAKRDRLWCQGGNLFSRREGGQRCDFAAKTVEHRGKGEKKVKCEDEALSLA